MSWSQHSTCLMSEIKFDLPSFPGLSGDSNTNIICEERGGVVVFVERISHHGLCCSVKHLSVYSVGTGGLIAAYLVLSDDVRHRLSAAGLQTLVGQRLEAHLVTVERGCLRGDQTVFSGMEISNEL